MRRFMLVGFAAFAAWAASPGTLVAAPTGADLAAVASRTWSAERIYAAARGWCPADS